MFQWQRREKSLAFLIYRWFLAAFFAIAVANSVLVNFQRGHLHVYFIYLTHLNLWATMATTTFGAFLVTLHHLDKLQIEKKIPTVLKIYSSMWNQSVVISIIVSISYWGFHYDGEKVDLNNWFIHIANSVVLMIDLIIVKHPPSYSNFLIPIIVELHYALFTIVYQLVGGLDK